MAIDRRRTLAATLAALASLPTAARAHGDAHAAHAGAPPPKEQKPWGIAGDARAVQRTIVVRMSDAMRFTPDLIRVRVGQTVRLSVRNEGRLLHELVIGTREQLEEHAALMAKFPDMQHDEPDMTHVPPGGTGSIVWTFNRAGEFEFACLIAGHFQSGMRGRIRVTRS